MRGLAARVFRYALRVPNSWAHATANSLRSVGVTLPSAFGVVPDCAPRSTERWKKCCVNPALATTSLRMRRAESSQLPSLATFLQCHPGLDFCADVHCSRLPATLVREWTLARCGHHPFLDGRAARHRALRQPCLCGSDGWTLIHALRSCPLFSSWRSTWLQRLHSLGLDGVDRLTDNMFLRLIFSTHAMRNARSAIAAHVSFVAGICQAQKSLLQGVEPHGASCEPFHA